MNLSFWLSMLLMLLVAILILVYPLIRVKSKAAIAYRESNLRLHEEKLVELDRDLAEGRIDQMRYKIARQELDRELLDDVPAESTDTAALHYTTDTQRQPALALAIAVFLPGLALLVYMQLGMHAASDMVAEQQKPMVSVEQMTAQLENRLRNGGGSLEEWTMLGRALKHLGRYADAADALATASKMAPNAQLLLEQAEAVALDNGQKFNARSRELVLDALSMEPDNVNALWFAGVAEFQFGNYRQSINHLSRLSAEAGVDEEINKSIRFYLEQARAQLVASGESVPAMEELLPVQETAAKAVSGAQLQVAVDVTAAVKQKFAAADVVFVYAKAEQGPKMPLAVQRLTLADLPASVVLDDNMAMVEGMNLSAFPRVIVSARVTKSGSAIAQSGDYIGQVATNVAGSDVLNITIDSMVP